MSNPILQMMIEKSQTGSELIEEDERRTEAYRLEEVNWPERRGDDWESVELVYSNGKNRRWTSIQYGDRQEAGLAAFIWAEHIGETASKADLEGTSPVDDDIRFWRLG